MLRVPYPQLGHVRLGAHIVTDIYPPLYHTQTTLAGATPAQPLQYTRANNPKFTKGENYCVNSVFDRSQVVQFIFLIAFHLLQCWEYSEEHISEN